MSNTITRGIDAIFVCYLCIEVWSAVYLTAINERRRIEISIDRWSDRIVINNFCAVNREPFFVTLGHEGVVVNNSKEINQARTCCIVDVAWYGKGKGELAILDTVSTIVEQLLAVIILESTCGCLLLLLTSDEFFCVTNGRCEQSLVIGLFVTGLCYVSFDGHNRATLECN